MDYRFLGRTGVRVSKLCYGTMMFAGDADESTSRAMYSRCRDAGINTFDTADVYAKGESERFLGRFISGHRDEVFIATKAYFPMGSDINARGSSRYHLVRAVEGSLKRLATDRIDLFYLHRFDDETDLSDTLRAVEDLVRQGKILYVGASNFAAWQVMKAIGIAHQQGWVPVSCIQPMYNLVKRQAEVELLPMCRSEGVACMPYSPLGGGLFTGKYGAAHRDDNGRLVKNAMYKVRYAADRNYETADRFCQVARELNLHPATLAVAWVAAQPGVTAPIIGTRTLEQLDPLLAASSVSLDPAVLARISSLSEAPPPATDRNEETSQHNYGQR